jgi:hypothetical protein
MDMSLGQWIEQVKDGAEVYILDLYSDADNKQECSAWLEGWICGLTDPCHIAIWSPEISSELYKFRDELMAYLKSLRS